MPLYNAGGTVDDSIRSVLAQTFEDFELIVIDDMSTDSGPNLVLEIAQFDPRVKFIRMSVNGGAGVARNAGIEAASGRYIAFLDSDDLWLPEKLEKQIGFMRANNLSFTCTAYSIYELASGMEIGCRIPPAIITYNELLYENVIGCLTVVFDTAVHGYKSMPIIRKRQDFALWLRILREADCHCIQEVLAHYRITPNSISSNKIEMLKFNYLMFRECEGFNSIKAGYFVFRNVLRKLSA
jgi:glycosyltransferase involved in cell wall biosynthesis